MTSDKPLLLVSTCGTSILTNVAEGSERQRLRSLTNVARLQQADDLALIAELRERATAALDRADGPDARRIAAELNATLGLLGERTVERGHHVLLHSDTDVGQAAAEVLMAYLKRAIPQMALQRVRIPDLTTTSLDGFRAAMTWLVRWAEENFPGWRPSHDVVLNLTGGFKSFNGFVQALGAFYADEMIYVFESETSPLLRIPRLPITLDVDALLAQHGQALRRLAVLGQMGTDRARDLPETLTLVVDDQVTLSEWGELVWQRASATTYAGALQDPVVDDIVYADRFRRDAAKLEPQRRRILNRRLDDLARYVADGRRHCPASLSFKSLEGEPVPGSTHEFYAWSDQDASRAFAHFEDRGADEVLVVDQLRTHL